LILCGHPERHAGQIQRREASDDKQIREIQKLENGVAPMTAAKAEGIPETHDPEPRRGKAALPHDPVTRSLCRLRERVERKKMKVPRQMIATPVAPAEQPVIQSAPARCFDQ